MFIRAHLSQASVPGHLAPLTLLQEDEHGSQELPVENKTHNFMMDRVKGGTGMERHLGQSVYSPCFPLANNAAPAAGDATSAAALTMTTAVHEVRSLLLPQPEQPSASPSPKC